MIGAVFSVAMPRSSHTSPATSSAIPNGADPPCLAILVDQQHNNVRCFSQPGASQVAMSHIRPWCDHAAADSALSLFGDRVPDMVCAAAAVVQGWHPVRWLVNRTLAVSPVSARDWESRPDNGDRFAIDHRVSGRCQRNSGIHKGEVSGTEDT